MTTPYHAKYFARELTRQVQSGGVDRLSMALFDACVDLNPHQIEAAMFALRSPLSKGVVLADEVGLGKTIEAGLVLCQHWAERKQWSLELAEKFKLFNGVFGASDFSVQAEQDNKKEAAGKERRFRYAGLATESTENTEKAGGKSLVLMNWFCNSLTFHPTPKRSSPRSTINPSQQSYPIFLLPLCPL